MIVLQFSSVLQVKQKSQYVKRCIVVERSVEFNPKKHHKCRYSKCVTCKTFLPNNHECLMQQHKFLDEIAYENVSLDKELIAKADILFVEYLQDPFEVVC